MRILDYFKRPEYLYHGTRLEKIPQIQTGGLYPRYFTREAVFLSDTPGFSAFWGNLEALIRVKKEDLNPDLLKKSIGYTGEYQYSGIIQPEILTIRRVSLNKNSGKLELTAVNE